MSKLRSTIWYEFYTIDNLVEPVITGMKVLDVTSFTTGIDTVPTLTIKIPLQDFPTDELAKIEEGAYFEPRMQRYLMVVHFQVGGEEKYTFRGVVDEMEIDYANYNATLNLSHEVARMREWAMPINYTVKDMPIDHLVGPNGAAIGYSNTTTDKTMQSYEAEVEIELRDFNTMPRVEITFTANNKLEALSEILRYTEYGHFWVDLHSTKPKIVIQNYEIPLDQQIKPNELTISPYPPYEDDCSSISHGHQVTLLTEPVFNIDYTDHYNRAVVFCGDIQDGVHHLTLEHIYSNPSLQEPMFPVKMYEYQINQQPETEYNANGTKINNEKIYRDLEVVAYYKNGNREFYVEDSKQLEEDSNIVLNTTFNFNDLYPIPELQKDINDDGTMEELVITDDDRVAIEQQAYKRAIRKLKSQRPERVYQFNCTALPTGTYDGQASRLCYAKLVNNQDAECENNYEQRKILNINQLFYITKRTVTFDEGMNETTTMTLDGEIRPQDISAVEIELREKAATNNKTGITDYTSVYKPYNENTGLFRDNSGAIGNTEHQLAHKNGQI